VRSLSRPGNHTTGVWLDDDLHAKRLEVLLDAFPRVRAIGVIVDRSWLGSINVQAQLLEPAAVMGLRVQFFIADEPGELATVLTGASAAAMDAWYVPATYIAYRAEAQIIGRMSNLGRPAIHATTHEVQEGGALMAYALDTSYAFDALATLVARIAAGEDAGDIPVQRPRRHTLAIRVHGVATDMRAAPSIVRRADILY
jgi:putative ABC transport system substrate-binding protein